MLYKVTKKFDFEASHQLELHDGKCKNLHGHSYKVWVTIARNEIFHEGTKKHMVIDFGDLKNLVKPLIDKLDHSHLNESLGTDSPTAEYVAAHIFTYLKSKLADHLLLVSIGVFETDDSFAEISDEPMVVSSLEPRF